MAYVFICRMNAYISIAQLVKNPPTKKKKNPPAVWETWVRSLGWENTLEKEHISTPVFWPGEFHGQYSPWGPKGSDMTKRISLHRL